MISDQSKGASRTTRYLDALLERHFKELKFGEVTRALRALSADYVEKREAGGLIRALEGRGKRAAFALYYGVTHFLATEALVREFDLGFTGSGRPTILDLGCGTGVCGAAWALGSADATSVVGADRSSFVLHEARWTYQILRIKAETSRSITETLDAIRRPDGIAIGWTLNELDDERRDRIAARILPWVAKGSRLLVVEPVSKRVAPWWDEWTKRFPPDRCSVVEKKLRLDLPPKIALLARSAGLSTDAMVVRVLLAPGPGEPPRRTPFSPVA
ncbi:MAG: class I SAM-dependent methyltransferase [Vicinamibacteria bacterium]|nr:class I SAM-dependent methyltransferase [Vicinamibacteria bacterium]